MDQRRPNEVAIDVDEATRKRMDYDRRKSLGHVTRYKNKRRKKLKKVAKKM